MLVIACDPQSYSTRIEMGRAFPRDFFWEGSHNGIDASYWVYPGMSYYFVPGSETRVKIASMLRSYLPHISRGPARAKLTL